MNDQEHADDHETGGVYETAAFLYSLRENVSEHHYEAAKCDGGNGHYHSPGEKLLTDVEFAESSMSEGNTEPVFIQSLAVIRILLRPPPVSWVAY